MNLEERIGFAVRPGGESTPSGETASNRSLRALVQLKCVVGGFLERLVIAPLASRSSIISAFGPQPCVRRRSLEVDEIVSENRNGRPVTGRLGRRISSAFHSSRRTVVSPDSPDKSGNGSRSFHHSARPRPPVATIPAICAPERGQQPQKQEQNGENDQFHHASSG